MLRPLVLPEGLVITLVVFPVCVHVGEKVGSSSSRQNRGDVGVSSRVVTVLVEGAIAVVRPGVQLA